MLQLQKLLVFSLKIFCLNYLAHLYLSGNNDQIKLGNFIGDAIKGSDYNNFSGDIRFGILLHRKIDTFTDKNTKVQKCTIPLREAYGKFSGAVVDILFDHFLAADWQNYSNIPLNEFAQKSYNLVENNLHLMPKKMQNFSHFFIKRNRLLCYADLKCFEDVLFKMGIYTALPAKSKQGMKIIKNNYNEFHANFKLFFIEIQTYVNELMKLKDAEPKTILKY